MKIHLNIDKMVIKNLDIGNNYDDNAINSNTDDNDIYNSDLYETLKSIFSKQLKKDLESEINQYPFSYSGIPPIKNLMNIHYGRNIVNNSRSISSINVGKEGHYTIPEMGRILGKSFSNIIFDNSIR